MVSERSKRLEKDLGGEAYEFRDVENDTVTLYTSHNLKKWLTCLLLYMILHVHVCVLIMLRPCSLCLTGGYTIL